MTYTDILALVIGMTARPDLVVENRVAIFGAVRKFHLSELYQRDLRVARINLALYPTNDFTWQIDTKSEIFQRFRKLYYATPVKQKYVATLRDLPAIPGDGIQVVESIPIKSPADLLDQHGLAESAYIYLAGNSLTLRLPNTNTVVELYYHQHPDIGVTGNTPYINSWVADDMPEAVAAEAAGTIFKMIGKDEEYQRHTVLFAENLNMLKQSEVYNN